MVASASTSFIEFRLSRQRLLERKQARLEGALQWRAVELLAPNPAPVSLTPVLADHVDATMAREEFQEGAASEGRRGEGRRDTGRGRVPPPRSRRGCGSP